jgi:DNA-binding SARP family transcriptional activator
MRFALLGTLMLVDDAGDPKAVPGPRQRALLASLLLSANVPVSSDALAEAVWDGSPPPGALTTLRSLIRRLRSALGPQAGARITACDPGYLISVQEAELDVLRFEAACRDAAAARWAARWPEASAAATRALELWRGIPLLDVPSQVLRDQFVPALDQLRLQALEDRAEADLRLGRHDRLIPELHDLTAQHPMRERFHGQLMEALAGAGRRAEALDAYRAARRALAEELGIEPGPHLRVLHQQILDGDPAVAVPQASRDGTLQARAPLTDSASSPAGAPVPRQLPASAAHFAGRLAELARLARILDQASSHAPGAVVISAISGTAGVGKTALAVHWAHQAVARFPDGQLYVNLRGYDSALPVLPADALAGFLRALGVPSQDLPAEADDRAALYRSLLAGRRMLVVLDNARSVEQVRPLLPGTPGCVAVVTSRDALAGLIARDGAQRVDLDVLPPAEAVGLLRALIGSRVDADLDAAAALVGLCCRLPLALRVAAELAARRLDVGLAELAGELADEQRRLDLLDADGDPRTAVRAVFSWSCRHLGTDGVRAFRLLGLHPGPDFDPYAAAALTGTSLERAVRLLDVLAQAHLIQRAGLGRYGMHDLLRIYARELAAGQDSEQDRREALTSLLDHYLHTIAAATDTMFPGESDRRARVPLPGTPGPAVTSMAAARAWLDAERATLTAIAAHAATSGWPAHATRLAATLFRYLETGGYYPEIAATQEHARRAAREAGDRAAEAEALRGLIVIDLRQGRYQVAADRLQQSLAVYRETGDVAREAGALGNLGIAGFLQGRYQRATSHLQQSLSAYRETGDRTGQARQLNNLSLIELRLGNYQQAGEHLDEAVAICRETGDRADEAYALSNLGVLSLRLEHYQQAGEQLGQALAACRETGNRDCEAYALGSLGIVASRQGNHQQAAEHLDQAVAICRETGDRSSEAEELNSLAEVHLAAGRAGDAQVQQAVALGLASQINDKYEQARAHNGLARSYNVTGDLIQARCHWQQALALYTDLGTPEAHHIRAQLKVAEASQPEPRPDRYGAGAETSSASCDQVELRCCRGCCCWLAPATAGRTVAGARRDGISDQRARSAWAHRPSAGQRLPRRRYSQRKNRLARNPNTRAYPARTSSGCAGGNWPTHESPIAGTAAPSGVYLLMSWITAGNSCTG